MLEKDSCQWLLCEMKELYVKIFNSQNSELRSKVPPLIKTEVWSHTAFCHSLYVGNFLQVK